MVGFVHCGVEVLDTSKAQQAADTESASPPGGTSTKCPSLAVPSTHRESPWVGYLMEPFLGWWHKGLWDYTHPEQWLWRGLCDEDQKVLEKSWYL